MIQQEFLERMFKDVEDEPREGGVKGGKGKEREWPVVSSAPGRPGRKGLRQSTEFGVRR